MNELIFPIGALLLLYLILIPLCTIIVHGILWLQKSRIDTWEYFGSDFVFQVLVLPVLLPFVWLLSSGIHLYNLHFEDAHWFSHHHFSCLLPHQDSYTDETFLILFLLLGAFLFGLSLFQTVQKELKNTEVVFDEETQARLEQLKLECPPLRKIQILLVENWSDCAGTAGVLYPKIVLLKSWAQQIDDQVLKAVLLHEAAHVQQKDVLRGALLRLSLKNNIFQRVLSGTAFQWREAREVYADTQAILWGADPLALADGIVQALRWKKQYLVNIDEHNMGFSLEGNASFDSLRLRITLLLGFSETNITAKKSRLHHESQRFIFGGMWLFLFLLPHICSWNFIDIFHYYLEYISFRERGLF